MAEEFSGTILILGLLVLLVSAAYFDNNTQSVASGALYFMTLWFVVLFIIFYGILYLAYALGKLKEASTIK